MNQEKALKTALEKGEAALDADDLLKAKNLLDEASSSKLLAKRYAKAAARLRDATSRALPTKPIEPKPPLPPPPQPPAPQPPAPQPKVDPAVALLEEGRRLMKDKQYPAAKTQLDKCVKVSPRAFDCHKLLGAAWAKLGDPDKGARAYREFIKLAPRDHPELDKVKAFLDAFENNR